MRLVSGVTEPVNEAEIQKTFEQNLENLEMGLVYVTSYVQIGTGIVDTLAVDDENNAVIIEFKRVGDFSRDALIQLMNYYSWFASDENHRAYLRDIIKKAKPQVDEIEDIRLVAIVSTVDDEVKNACWALEPSIMLITYKIFRDTAGELNIIPSVILDTEVGGEKLVKPPKTEEDHLRQHENLRPLYMSLKKMILDRIDPTVRFNPAPQNYIGILRKRTFAAVHFKDKWIRLDLLLKAKDTSNSPRYTDYPSSQWGYVNIESQSNLDEELVSWVKLAFDKAG